MSFAFFKNPAFRYASAGFAVAIVGYAGYHIGVPVAKEFNTSFAMKEFRQYGVLGTYQKHLFSFASKFHDLGNLENENESLRSQLAILEKNQTLDEASRAERELASMNEVLEKKVKAQGGSTEARLPQTITYQVPEHVTPAQVYSLGLAYFRKEEFEKSSVIFNYILTLEEESKYRTPENYLMSGISWFHLKNYVQSRKQIEVAIRNSKSRSEIHRQALLWDAMVEKTIGNTHIAQTKLLFFIGQYPHSVETAWINGNGNPARGPAHENSKEEHHAVE